MVHELFHVSDDAEGFLMPVLDHEIHPSTQKGPEYRAGCWSKPRPTAETFYWAKKSLARYTSGTDPHIGKIMLTKVYHTMSTACRVLDSDVLPECQGCTAEKDVEYIKTMKGLK